MEFSMANDPALNDQIKAALADIQQPPLPDEFYLAPGYLLLAVLFVLLVSWLVHLAIKNHRRNSARRMALKQLAEINPQQSDAANRILWLLKQYLQTKQPGHAALAMQTAAFLQFLQQSAALTTPLPDLNSLLYAPAPAVEQVQAWQQFARQWLLQHKELSLYV